MQERDTSLPLLDSNEWLNAVDHTDQGEILLNPFSGWVPPIVRGRPTVLGAQTETGKTALGLQWFKEVIDGGYSGCYITLEMTPADLWERFRHQFENDEEARDWIQTRPAYVSQPYVDAYECEQIIRKGFDFVVLDHIHELPWDGHEDLARKVKRLASLAPAMNTGLLMLSQVKQPDPFREGPPTKYDFSNTKAIGEVAALAFILQVEDEESSYLELHCVKNRFGPKSQPFGCKLDTRTVTFKGV